eukprot:XP_011660637.1 PREDICTED: androglobin isoform X28 [Strongylocentrotus purpuratus]
MSTRKDKRNAPRSPNPNGSRAIPSNAARETTVIDPQIIHHSASGTYRRHVTYPDLPLSLDEIYDRTTRYTDKFMARPIIFFDEDDDELGASIKNKRGSAERRMTIASSSRAGSRKTSLAPGLAPQSFDAARRGTIAAGGGLTMGAMDFRRFATQGERDAFVIDAAASIAASVIGSQEGRKQKVVIWPEWSDADVNGEKWDAPHKPKEKEKGKSPSSMQHFFDDPEGRIELPTSLRHRVDHWRRPQDFITDKTPVVYDPDSTKDIDLLTNNEHLDECETLRWITSQITNLWHSTATPITEPHEGATIAGGKMHPWRPWDHIYALCKVGKAPHLPLYNPHGKYIIRVYWMGTWRKVTVDDTIPFDDNGKMLLPCSRLTHELWPMLLTKALIKVFSLDYSTGSSSCEFGDVTVIQTLTGWLPETIPLQYGHLDKVWELMRKLLPEFKLPDLDPPPSEELPPEEAPKKEKMGDEMSVVTRESNKDGKGGKGADGRSEKGDKDSRVGHKEEVKEGKKDKKDKKDDKDKDKRTPDKEQVTILDKDQATPMVPESPQVTLFVSYVHPPKIPVRISVLGEMADASERLRQNGLSHVYPHPLMLTQTRSCPLVAPPPPPKIPSWKLIRPKKKKPSPTDEPSEPEVKKPEQFVELTSQFVNYKVSSVPIPTDTKRPNSSLSRGAVSRPETSQMGEICEVDENAPEKTEEEVAKEKEAKQRAEEEAKRKEAMAAGSIPDIQMGGVVSPGLMPNTSPRERQKSARKSSSVKIEKIDEKKAKDDKKDQKLDIQSPAPKKSAKKSRGTGEKERMFPGKLESKVSLKDLKGSGVKEKGKEGEKEKSSGAKDGGSGLGGALKPPGTSEGYGLDQPPDTYSVMTDGVPRSALGEGSVMILDGETPAGDNRDKAELCQVDKKVWMDFEDFCKCFKTLYVFHKPSSYMCTHKVSDLKSELPGVVAHPSSARGVKEPEMAGKSVQPTAGKKSAAPGGPANPSGSMTSQTPARMPFSPSPPHHRGPAMNFEGHKTTTDDRSPHYMFVDNLEPTEIIVSFSSLSRWFDPPADLPKTSHSSTRGKDQLKDTESIAGSSSVADAIITPKDTPVTPTTPGLLVAEPYSWKSLVVGQPILRIRSTFTKAAALTLPPGRHVLRFMMTAPLGYHVHLCSTVPFVYGDEETVMTHLTKESCRFVDQAMQVMQTIGNAIQNFDNKELFNTNMKELGLLHCPVRDDTLAVIHNHEVFKDALYNTLRKSLTESLTPEMTFAWKAFNFDVLTKNIAGIPVSQSRPAPGIDNRPSTGASRKSAKLSRKKTTEEAEPQGVEVPDHWVDREPTEGEDEAVTMVAKYWRGCYVRKVKAARSPGTTINVQAKEQLQKAWSIMEPNLEQHALHLFRTMFKTDPDLMPDFTFYQDEWNKISYVDFQGTYQEQPPHTWFVVFRDVLFVQEPMLVVPKLYCSIPTCMLRVVDNDTGEEIPRVFQRVAPYEYKKNRRGYTFLAEARTSDLPLASGKWRMRLIGSSSPLPQPARDGLNSSFLLKEIRDYYIPNKENIIMRYVVKPQEDHVSSIQFGTSKSDVYISLDILDNEESVASTSGKGHAVIPAFTFLRDREPGEDEKRSSRSSAKGARGHGSTVSIGSGKRKPHSASSHDGRGSRASRASGDLNEEEMKPHKYIIQAKVMRKSWPMSESSWAFVQVLKELEKNELKDIPKSENPRSPTTTSSPSKTNVTVLVITNQLGICQSCRVMGVLVHTAQNMIKKWCNCLSFDYINQFYISHLFGV